MPTVRQAFSYIIITLFILFFFSDGIVNQLNTFQSLAKNRFPDFSVYHETKTLTSEQFPLEDASRRIIVVGDIHGMHKHLSALLNKLSYDANTDVLIHVGDIITKGTHNGSMEILSYMTSNNVTGVRGNHDQTVIEWRGWINWVNSLPGGRRWLENTHKRWSEAEADGVDPASWMKKEKKRSDSKWWKMIPAGWVLFSDHFMISYAMTDDQYEYMRSLPLKLYIPSAHTYIVHAGLLPSDPRYPHNHARQPLARVPSSPSATGGNALKNETFRALRGLQELAVLSDVPQNKVPWDVLNMRSVLDRKVTKTTDGKAWSKLWRHDMSRCEGFDHDVISNKPKKELLPCYPSSVIYGHAASRGLDIKRWSVGLDSGCVYGRRLTALVLGVKPKQRQVSFTRQREPDGLGNEDGDSFGDKDEVTSIPFGDQGRGTIVSITCS